MLLVTIVFIVLFAVLAFADLILEVFDELE
jgi:hypothetical protein